MTQQVLVVQAAQMKKNNQTFKLVVLVLQEARRIHSPSKTQLIPGKIKTSFFTID